MLARVVEKVFFWYFPLLVLVWVLELLILSDLIHRFID